jgi:hypothetical protein
MHVIRASLMALAAIGALQAQTNPVIAEQKTAYTRGRVGKAKRAPLSPRHMIRTSKSLD